MRIAIAVGFVLGMVSSAFDAKAAERPQLIEQDTVRAEVSVARSLAAIKSSAELRSHLNDAVAFDSPLAVLSDVNLNRFVASLTFNERGLSGYSYLPLADLSASQAHDILALFGVQRTTSMIADLRVESDLDKALMSGSYFVRGVEFSTKTRSMHKFSSSGEEGQDYDGYWCASRATCSRQVGSICMSSC
ncbi:MAG: hypothetical protein ING71_14840 [Rhodocyclaceae bacterium]|nr:hypothetical protein [Rhodocyclaceae bacterium]MCA3042952.1 hypothetical protein [Rhodocyclaceae bacterium]MCA3054282.1 hypothetical protein [Rhodocyclaceae bacterium]MCA3080055.1 hypothetical protein [Rhodocyclaceae bacterium]MCA3081913.1 hypothetical protein [Rhodocyclaceae bacterium]